ncbi:MAG: hypothetical protein WA108_03155 [Thiobacillus sp.]|jgi:hypothetical protein
MSRPPDWLACIGLAALLVLSGCASTLNLDTGRPPSHAVSRHTGSPLEAQLTKQIPRYQPRLVAENTDNGMAKRLQWRDIHQGTERISDVEPEATPIQRGLLRVLQALPIEGQL